VVAQPGMHCALYRRVSTHQQVDGFSLDDQLSKLTDLAESKGSSWIDFCDAGRSGESLDNRPALTHLLSRLGEFDAVLVVDDSRLARDELVSAIIRQKLQASATKLITPSGTVDLNDPQSRFTSGVISLASQLEQQLRTEKMVAGHRRAAEAGFSTGGPPPFGFRYIPDPQGSSHQVLEINKMEADVLRTAISCILDDGISVYATAKRLNAHSLCTRSGKPWHYRNLTFQLKKSDIAGTRTYHAATGPISLTIPAIIDQVTWDRLQTSIRGKATGKPTKRKFYPLTGHLDCPCGGHLSGFPKPKRRKYKCSRNSIDWGDNRCDQYPRYRDAQQLETAVWDEVKKVVTDPDYLKHLLEAHLAEQSPSTHLSHDQRTSLKRRITELHQEQVTITREYASAGIDANVLRTAIDAITTDIETLNDQLAKAEHWEDVRKMKADAVASLTALAERARETLAWPTPELMKEVFDLLDIRVLVAGEGLQIHGMIPIGAWDEDDVAVGQLQTGVLRDHVPLQPRFDQGVGARLRARDLAT